LVVECHQLDANVDAMANAAHSAGMALRPHAKSHKCAEISRRQVAAGAIGISCATVLEAECMAKANLDRLLVTSPVVGTNKLSRLIALHRKASVMTVVDHPLQVDALASQLTDQDAPMRVLVDVDVGQCRTGVISVEAGLQLAKQIADSERLHFAGLQAFAGHVQHIVDPEERQRAAQDAMKPVRALCDRLSAERLSPSIISGGGTGTSAFDLREHLFTELQVGSYVFMDSDYGRLRDSHDQALPYQRSLFVLATVISVSRPGQVTVDAGTKALATNGPLPDCILGVPPDTSYKFAGDEHGILYFQHETDPPELGTRVLIGVTHCDPTINLFSSYAAVTAAGLLEIWPVIARYDVAA
jgi:D-serine deaminase-like pyridoxal phosphate-dependent protein